MTNTPSPAITGMGTKRFHEAIEGPSKAQVRKMVALIKSLDPERQWELIFDTECTLREYGYDPETGKYVG